MTNGLPSGFGSLTGSSRVIAVDQPASQDDQPPSLHPHYQFCVLLDAVRDAADEVIAGAAEALAEAGRGFSVTASRGTVTIPEEADDVSAALHIADTRMYATKNRRRAATIIAQTRDVLLCATAEHSATLPEHMLEVGELSRNVARRLELDAETIELTLRTGELHDVGKLAIPRSILHKPSRLDDAEWTFIRNHTLIGERVLNAAPALRPICQIGAINPRTLRRQQLPRRTQRRADPLALPDRVRVRLLPRDDRHPSLRPEHERDRRASRAQPLR
jgi:HD domain